MLIVSLFRCGRKPSTRSPPASVCLDSISNSSPLNAVARCFARPGTAPQVGPELTDRLHAAAAAQSDESRTLYYLPHMQVSNRWVLWCTAQRCQ